MSHDVTSSYYWGVATQFLQARCYQTHNWVTSLITYDEYWKCNTQKYPN